MSSHRIAAIELADALLRESRRAVGEAVVQGLVAGGGRSFTIDAFCNIQAAPELVPLQRAVDALIQAASLDEFKRARINIDLAPRERIGRCIVGPAVSSRRLNIVDVRITAEVETRWVHLLPDTEFARQWVIA